MTLPRLSESLGASIADQLRIDLLSGRLQAGQRLSEVALAEQFGVSRTPIREAFVQLSREGLLEARRNAGVRVAATAPDEIRDLVLPIRSTLESFALRSIFDDLQEADFQRWEQVLLHMNQACVQRDFAGTAEQDIAFHRSIIDRTHHADLLAIWSTLVVRLRSYFWESHRGYNDLMDVYREHRQLVDTFRGGDVDTAVQALTASMS